MIASAAPARPAPAPPLQGRPPHSNARILETVAKATDGRDDIRSKLLADARDEHFDGVGIAVEVLIVDMLDQFGAADDLALVVHQVGQELILLSRKLYRLTSLGHLAR